MPEKPQSQSLAVLIDAGNTGAHHAHAIFEEIVKLGEANVRRIYGDFSGTRLAGWDKQIQSLAILQHQQRSNTTGKNASDIAFVIDAMDLTCPPKPGPGGMLVLGRWRGGQDATEATYRGTDHQQAA